MTAAVAERETFGLHDSDAEIVRLIVDQAPSFSGLPPHVREVIEGHCEAIVTGYKQAALWGEYAPERSRAVMRGHVQNANALMAEIRMLITKNGGRL